MKKIIPTSIIILGLLFVPSIYALEITSGGGKSSTKYHELQIKLSSLKARANDLRQQINAQKTCQDQARFYMPASPSADVNGCVDIAITGGSEPTVNVKDVVADGGISSCGPHGGNNIGKCTYGTGYLTSIYGTDRETPVTIKLRLKDNYGNVFDDEYLFDAIKHSEYTEDQFYNGKFQFYVRSQNSKMTGLIFCNTPNCQLTVEEFKIYRKNGSLKTVGN